MLMKVSKARLAGVIRLNICLVEVVVVVGLFMCEGGVVKLRVW